MIQFENVGKSFASRRGPVKAVVDFTLKVAASETLCLIGTSGSGKTTVLKMVNRLIEPSEGVIRVEGRDVIQQDVIRLRRSIGYVIQKGGLFPHKTVADNVGLLCRLQDMPAPQRIARVQELLALVDLPDAAFGHRYPHELSGGQQQRVGIARALALDPPILLMDEPFGALDPITRTELQRAFRKLAQRLHKTVVLVTHDMAEAFALGDRIALMDGGRLLQVGTATDFRERPATEFVARFVSEQMSPAVSS